MKKELPKAYNAQDYEDRIYKKWEKSGYFNPDKCIKDRITKKDAKSFTISLPPPNRTGTLHIGHALMLVIQDILTRYHRMKGEKTLWVPGTDHAAIATQSVVEKKLYQEEKKTRHDFGRERFLHLVRDFADQSHKRITEQVKKMGSSLDWSREAYTLDEVRNKVVNSVFKLMYDDGLIYRGDRVINWCPRCHSTLSDDEVEYETQKAKLYTFKYASDFPFTIATTRPETKLGDTAVAVNPKDGRYKKYVGKTCELDFVGVPLKLKIIADRAVDPEFGTGALGVTPAHSMVDWQMAQDNNLDIIKVIDEDGKIHPGFADYSGVNVIGARGMIVKKLLDSGLLEKEEEIENNLSICYRCSTPVEPLPSKQWFIDVNKKIPKFKKSIKELSIEAVKKGVFNRDKINIIPERFAKNYFHWMNDLRDWCISRQIWFGHRIPVWYREDREVVNFCFMRHGQTDWNKNSIMQGQTDTELNEIGKKQAKDKSIFINQFNPDIIITSPLKRTVDTVKIAVVDKYKIIKDDRINERFYGEIQGKSSDEIKKQYPDLESFTKNNLPYLIECPGGETYEEVYERCEDFFKDILKKHKGKKVLVMSHGDTLDMFDAIIENKPWREGVGAWHDNARVAYATLRLDKGKILKSESEEVYVGVEEPKGPEWVQDPDTLDTWFSSGLWTFSTLSQDEKEIKIKDGELIINNDDFKTYHPTSVMETGYDILFFWVARMIIMTTYAVEDIPFQDVYLHGLVRDDKGRKMSKSLGNVIDPIDVCKKYGTDAVRLSLVIGTTPGNDLNLSEEKISGFRNFANKLWNISRFIMARCHSERSEESRVKTKDQVDPISFANAQDDNLTLADRWILAKMHNLIKEVTEDLDNYRFSQAGEKLRIFTWSEFADWYIEISKFEKNKEKEIILSIILQNILKLWHPFIPFVTETLWQEMGMDKLLMIEQWPQSSAILSDSEEFQATKSTSKKPRSSRQPASRLPQDDINYFEIIKEIIVAIRNARAQNGIKGNQKLKAVILAGNKVKLIESQAELIKSLRTGVEKLEVKEKCEAPKDIIKIEVNDIKIYLI